MNPTSKRAALAILRALRSTIIIVAVAAVVVAFRSRGGPGFGELRMLAAQNWGILVMVFLFVAIWDYLMKKPKPPPGPPQP